ncbi:CDP-glycerol--poly(glycerophosphate) glycerophosphotransferase [bacterium]|nr:CDP-glycerol--poly(glycerophosphate) glycerophosphotransferase [bacterium]
MSELNLLEKIFSITNNGTDKLIMFCGIPIRFDRTGYYRKVCKKLPVQKNKIIFNNFQGSLYGCNPKYVAEEIIKRNLPYELYWLCKGIDNIDTSCFPEQIRLTPFKKKQGLKDLASAKIIIGNVRSNLLIQQGWVKKENQKYIQCWHGSLGIKKIDGSVTYKDYAERNWCDVAHTDSEYTNYLLSNSTFEDKVFEEGFWYNGPILKTGHPRNDVFFKSDEEKEQMRQKVYSLLEIPLNKKILLYVPSFRDDKRLYCYGLNTDKLISALESKFGGEWVVAIRMHPHLKKYSSQLFKFSDKVIDASFYPDIQELLVASDSAITDYSSCIFDFMLSRKPGFIFATDIEDYNTERGFYYPLESTPFPVAVDNNDLEEKIKNFDLEKYQQQVEDFLKDKGCMEDGHAAERVVDLIEQIMKEEN